MTDTELQFRRQFFLGRVAIRADHGWHSHLIGGRHLSWHPDLEVSLANSDGRSLALLGYWVDPAAPELSSQTILDRVSAQQSIEKAIAATDGLTGRWALVWASPDALHVFHDPCGLRMVHYAQSGGDTLCASQPELIRTVHPLRTNEDPEWKSFTSSPGFVRREAAVFGDRTFYSECFRLMPNHALDVRSGRPWRYFPTVGIPQVSTELAAARASEAIRGSVLAMQRRAELILAVTAGWDSRVLLAAARPVTEDIRFFVNSNRLPRRHPDIRIPLRLARRLGFDFTVNDTSVRVPDDLLALIHSNVTGARGPKKLNAVHFHLQHNEGRYNVNGNGSEICRQFWGQGQERTLPTWPPETLAAMVGYPGSWFVTNEIDRWLGQLPPTNIATLDLLYWEHRMGHWGALYPAEQDVAMEQFSPFNNRNLLATLLGVDAYDRSAPDFNVYRRMVELLWPEAMAEAVNPPTMRTMISRRIPRRVKRVLKRAVALHR